ncbi:hypothetical protein N7462_000100 [Penicillium macrosclerotiorum]|uniref:uncharacterized protein n=1 Tax=Penicillium macrosclerotiorum TaxID=303699 RepID=UPI002547884B|nr:uncharacterized protein N7462_000100 [Penicillium macrosclerotiorum]KAJ5698095.1 hypothetical protein N7462_000100 [Penicillium macrosclerotiorum]
MPADDSFAFLAAEQPKPVKKPHWRDKLLKSRDKSNRSTADQQIQDFLASNRPVPVPVATNQTPAKSESRDGTPTTVSTHQIPSAHDVSPVPPPPIPPSMPEQYVAFNPKEAPPEPRELPDPPRSRPHRMRKGLHVGFSDRVPEIIGEGGDETETPTIEISRDRQHARDKQQAVYPQRTPSRSPNPSRSHLPALTVNTSLGDGDGRSRRGGYPQGQQRGASPSASPNTSWKPPLMSDPRDTDMLSTVHLETSGSRLSFRGSPDSHSFAERVRNQMQAEEGRALQQHRYDEDTASPADDDEDDLSSLNSPPSHSPRSPDESVYDTPASQAGPSLKSIVQSIRHPSRPAVHRDHANLSPVDPRIPPNLTPGSPAKSSPGPPRVPTHEPQPPPMNQAVSLTGRDGRESVRTPQSAVMNQVGTPVSSHSAHESSRGPQPPKMSLRSVANQIGDTSFSDFKDYVAKFDSLFQMAAENVKPLVETALAEWIRAAVWWFLRGKTRLEAFARARATAPPSYAKQAVVDLGKSLWINENIVPGHYELSRYGSMNIEALLAVVNTTGDKEMMDLLTLHQTLLNHLRSLSMSIKRNNILSVIASDDHSPSHLDTSVWLRYPFFAPDVSTVLSGNASRSMLADKPGKSPSMIYMMPLGDTSRYFSYGTMFVQACVSSSDDDGQQYAMPCALTIVRERSDWYVFAAITSQSQLVNVMIQSDRKQGPTWDDVDWQVRSHSMRVKLPRGFELDVMFKEDDFKTLWNIVKYTQKSEASLSPEPGENVVFESTVKVFQYMDSGSPKAFPSEPLERCRIRLFERSVTVTEGTGKRNAHRGFRLTVLTSPKVKTLSHVKHLLGYGSPVVFGLLRGEDGAPALLLKVTEDGRTRSMLMTFHEVEERTKIHSVLLGMVPRNGETKTPDIPLRSYTIEQPGDSASGRPPTTCLSFPAGNACVIDQEHDYVDHGYGPTILSEHLRAFIATEWGSVTDRINLGPGELKIGLDVNRVTGMSLFRPAQQDLTVSLADNLIKPEMPDQVSDFLRKITASPMVRRLDFGTMQDLHAFEQAVTGFQVIYDGIASSFTISRRRMVVPIYKKWEASLARIQIVRQEKVTQLLAFFADFHHGTCMNFVLKGTDHIETFGRSGKFGIRIVDAKFALPKKDDDPASNFVCLDMPEYPIEHDDIAIAFDTEAGESLPRPLFRLLFLFPMAS